MKNYAVILASGIGSRFGGDTPKQYLKINNKTIFEYSIEAFEKNKNIDEIIVVVNEKYNEFSKNIISKNNYRKINKVLNGGKLRKDSSYIAVNSINDSSANILIHDCARPLVSQKIIDACIEALSEHYAVGVAIPTSDTIIKVENNAIKEIPSRKDLMQIQTPQCFKLSVIKKAHELSKDDSDFTDDCGLVLKHNLAPIHIVEGEDSNIKITYKKDIELAKEILKNV